MLPYIVASIMTVLCAWLLLQNYHYEKKANNAMAKLSSQERYYEQVWKDYDTIRAYIDDKHLCWNDGLMEFFSRVPSDRELVVLIRGDALYKLYHGQWEDGRALGIKDSESLIDGLQREVEEMIVNVNTQLPTITSFENSRFDHEFALFINQLTDVGRRFAGTQQLRERMAHCVIEYRKYLAAKQRGELVLFPKQH